jgi:hypothetical protein
MLVRLVGRDQRPWNKGLLIGQKNTSRTEACLVHSRHQRPLISGVASQVAIDQIARFGKGLMVGLPGLSLFVPQAELFQFL